MSRAKCPMCGKKLMWDWQGDVYIVAENSQTMVMCPCIPMECSLKDVEVDAHICTCGKIIGFSVVDEDGQTVYNHPMLEGIDWEAEGHAWDSNMGPLTPIEELLKIRK